MVRRVLNIIREEYAEEPADEFGTSSTEAAPSREQLKSLKTLVTKNLDKACAAADWRMDAASGQCSVVHPQPNSNRAPNDCIFFWKLRIKTNLNPR
jgi:hypothetical protein